MGSQKEPLPEEWLKKTSELAVREGFMGKFKAVFILRLCLTFLGAVNRRERGVIMGRGGQLSHSLMEIYLSAGDLRHRWRADRS